MAEKSRPQSHDEYVLRLTEQALDPANIAAGMCFLCGRQPTEGKGEHVIPRWLQNRFDLWDSRLGLLNGTLLPYRSLRVPACEECNVTVLGKTEAYVSELTAANVQNWTVSDSYEVGRWMAKILVGILYKETSLLFDRRQPDRGSIFPPDAMDEIRLLHLLIQSWRKRILFRAMHTDHPFTLYVYSVEKDAEYGTFNLSTNIFGQSVCIRFGELGFAFVGDGGLQHEMAQLGPYKLSHQCLHPVQFDELAARVHYKSALRDATHNYFHAEEPDTFRFQQMAVVPYSKEKLPDGSDRVFRDWSEKQLAEVFRRYDVPGYEYLLDGNGDASYTRLVDDNGKKLTLSE